MAAYLLSFEIQSDSTYQSRYKSLVDYIRDEAADGYTWDETTSFMAFSSKKSLSTLHHEIYFSTKLFSSDKYLIICLTTGKYDHRGLEYPALLGTALTG